MVKGNYSRPITWEIGTTEENIRWTKIGLKNGTKVEREREERWKRGGLFQMISGASNII